MHIRTAIRRIKKYRPTTPAEFAWAGVPLYETKPVGAGVFREVLGVVDLPLVVKFPISDGKDGNISDGRRHTNEEVCRINKLSGFPKMRKFLPKIYYHDPKAGVVVMRWYPDYDKDYEEEDMLGHMIQRLVYDMTGVMLSDVHTGNVRSHNGKHGGRTILIDLGY